MARRAGHLGCAHSRRRSLRHDSDESAATANYDLPDELVAIAAHGPYDHHGRDAHADAAPAIGWDAAAATMEFVFLYFSVVRRYKGVEGLVAAFDLLLPNWWAVISDVSFIPDLLEPHYSRLGGLYAAAHQMLAIL